MTDQLLADIEASRLVTLTGVPGAGKSRMAAELAGQIAERGQIDVKVVDLREVPPGGLFEQLKDQPGLLVLDNCEHLIDDVAALAQELLCNSPNLRILTTSCDRLGITGEVVRHVARPEPNYDDELPATAIGRHRNADEAMAASEAMLTDGERTLLRRLATFAGGFSLEAARQVCSDEAIEARQVLRLLGRLVDTSLVEVDNIAGRSRYRLAPVVVAHAEARLVEAGEEEQIRSAHAVFFVSLVEAVPCVGLHRVRHTALVAQLQAEHDNLGAALAWAVSQRRAGLAIRLAQGQLVLWRVAGAYLQAAESLAKVLPIAGHAAVPLQASVHCDAGLVAAMLGEYATSSQHLEQSLLLVDGSDPSGAASARNVLAMISLFHDSPAVARRALEDNLQWARGAGRDDFLSDALSALATARMLWGQTELAAEAYEEAIAAARRAGDDALVAQALLGAGWAALIASEFNHAEVLLEEGLVLAANLGERYQEAVALGRLGELARLRGDAELAFRRFEDSRALAASMATPLPLAQSLIGLARLALDDGHTGKARAWLYEALQIATRSGLAHLVAAALEALAQVVLTQGNAQAAARFEWALGTAQRCGDKATIARCLFGLATTARRSGDVAQACALQHQALEMRHKMGDRAGSVDSLEALAGLAIHQASPVTAARLFGVVEALRDTLGYPRASLAEDDFEADLAMLREALKEPELAEAWARGAAMGLAEAVSYASRGRGRQRRARLGCTGLTDTERQVAALVAEGLKNAEVAERMLMARETVKSHVSRILSKLEVKSRRELAELVRNDTSVSLSAGDGSRSAT